MRINCNSSIWVKKSFSIFFQALAKNIASLLTFCRKLLHNFQKNLYHLSSNGNRVRDFLFFAQDISYQVWKNTASVFPHLLKYFLQPFSILAFKLFIQAESQLLETPSNQFILEQVLDIQATHGLKASIIFESGVFLATVSIFIEGDTFVYYMSCHF